MLPTYVMPYAVIAILLLAMILFISGRWRFDIVALIALMLGVLIGAVPYNQVYSGLNNPAVITVACIMVISQTITRSGVLSLFLDKINTLSKNKLMHIISFSVIIGLLSAFMNNVGALALMLPISVKTSFEHNRSPSLILMPIAYASALGGMVTLIGTPPNLIVSMFRERALGQPYDMFDFSYVGLLTAIIGVLFVSLIGWRFLTLRRKSSKKSDTVYVAELVIPAESKYISGTLKAMKDDIKDTIKVVSFFRDNERHNQIGNIKIKKGDMLVVEATIDDLQMISSSKDLAFETQVTGDSMFVEVVVPSQSSIHGKRLESLRNRSQYRIAALAIAKRKRTSDRLSTELLQLGDTLLVLSKQDVTQEDLLGFGLLPITELNIRITSRLNMFLPLMIFLLSIVLLIFKVFPVQVAFGGAVLFMVLFKVTSLNQLYEYIDWPIIILLAAMIPLGHALETTGGADMISSMIFSASHFIPLMLMVGLVLVITMTLSDLINNAATAVIMSPIAIQLGSMLHISPDKFLMAVAIGASCAFLTPIGHQNNLLVMGPGQYRFFDYLRIGGPLEVIIVLVATPLIYWIW